ncbi:MAG: hypothetical protein AB1753_00415, partial [Thermoproteota archaeon]
DTATEKQQYSFDPFTNKSYDVSNVSAAKSFHSEYADGDNDVYVVAVTNNRRKAGIPQTSRALWGAMQQSKNKKPE